jgi:hypothetical protein
MLFVALVLWWLGVCSVDAQTCTVCPVGKYKDLDANVACSVCGSNKFLNATGATDASACLACPALSTSVPGSPGIALCLCNPGYYRPANTETCVQCPLGTYKAGSGNDVSLCVACAAYTTTLPSTVATGQVNCVCAPGFTFPGGATSCQGCAIGFYKPDAGGHMCTQCPASYSTTPAVNSSSLLMCMCERGYTGPNGGTCGYCGVGTYKDTLGEAACTNCPIGTHHAATSRTSVAACGACVGNSTTYASGSVSIDACKCNAGFSTANDNTPSKTCVACGAGKFSLGNTLACSSCGAGRYSVGGTTTENCLVCAANTYSPDGALQCTSCLADSWAPVGSAAITNCTCNAGFWPRNNPGQTGAACLACSAGTYKTSPDTSNCTLCAADRYSTSVGALSGAVCLTCPTASVSESGSATVAACKCDTGYIGTILASSDTCAACVPGKFSNVTAGTACVDCPRTTYSVATAKKDGACTSCGAFATSPPGSASFAGCVCAAGYGSA